MATSPKPSAGAKPPTPSKKRQSPSSSKESPSRKKQKTDDDGDRFDISLQDWLAAEVVDPITRRNPHDCSNAINIVKDEIKKPIRDLVSIFFDLCESDRCCDATKTLVEGNVGLRRGNVVLRKVHTEPHTNNKCAENFRKLRRFIRKTFFKGFEKDLPADMFEWLSLLEGACGHRVLVNDHLALMNERARRNFIVQWSDIVPQLDPEQHEDYINACKELPDYYHWKSKVTNIYALEEVFKKRSYKRRKPTNQTRFFRNFLVHFLDFCRLGERYDEELYFKYDDGLDILLSVFEKSIAVFPHLLYDNYLLGLFKPNKFF